MGGVPRHHSAQQLEQSLANLMEGSAACPWPCASHYSVAIPRQELIYTTESSHVSSVVEKDSDVHTKMVTQSHCKEKVTLYKFKASNMNGGTLDP